MSLPNHADTLTGLRDRIAALTLPSAFDPLTPPAFARVAVFDMSDLAAAMEETVGPGIDRACFVILGSVSHEPQMQSRTMTVTQTAAVSLLFSDRRYRDRQIALLGDASTPGALLLAKILIDGVSGELPNGCIVRPGNLELMALADEDETDNNGVIAATLDLSVHAGFAAFQFSRAARSGNP